MDDNAILILTNGERIFIPKQVTSSFYYQPYLSRIYIIYSIGKL